MDRVLPINKHVSHVHSGSRVDMVHLLDNKDERHGQGKKYIQAEAIVQARNSNMMDLYFLPGCCIILTPLLDLSQKNPRLNNLQNTPM